MSVDSKRAVIQWFKKNEPFIYRVALRREQLKKVGNQNLNGMGAFDWSSIGTKVGDIFGSLTSTVSSIAPEYLKYRQQKKIMDLQLERAKKGLAPINAQDYTQAIKLDPQINEQTEEAITRVAKQTNESAIKQALPYMLGFGALALLTLKRGR